MSGALLERLQALGLRRITRCRLTKNRNVMVSFAGDEIRVHEGYLAAPDDILRAIVDFVEAPTRAERLRARRRLLGFPIIVSVPARRRRKTHPDDTRLAEQLMTWHARYNRELFRGQLREVTVRVSRRMRARLGHYTPTTSAGDPPEIAISRRHLRRDGWTAALQTLVHEMVHQWQDESGLDVDHGRTFRVKAREVGIAPCAKRTLAA